MLYKRSSMLFNEAKKYIPGGVNSPVRAFKSVGGSPIFASKALGAYVYDEDGNKYIDDAIKKGAKTIISNKKFEGIKNKVLFLRSKNVRKLLSELSYKITKNKPKNLIAVTGTNGKSSIADFYFQLLNLSNKKVASIGTLGIRTKNNLKNVSNTTLDPIGLSKILNDLKKQRIDNVILEASSHGLKQNRLDGLKFNTAIFTNLSHDHLDYHKTFNDYLKSKLYLFEKLLKPRGSIITDSKIPEYKNLKIYFYQ